MTVHAGIACALLCLTHLVAVAPPPAPQPDDGLTRLVFAIERAVRAGDGAALRALARPDARSPQLEDFVQTLTAPRTSLLGLKERDRAPLDSGRVRLMLE